MASRAWKEEGAAEKWRRTATSPLVVRFLWNSREHRRPSAERIIGSGTGSERTATIIRLECSSITRQASYRLAFYKALPLHASSLCKTLLSSSYGNDWCKNFQCFTGTIFSFFQWYFYQESRWLISEYQNTFKRPRQYTETFYFYLCCSNFFLSRAWQIAYVPPCSAYLH